MTITPKTIDSIAPYSKKAFTIYINQDKNSLIDNYTGYLNIIYQTSKITLPIKIIITSEDTENPYGTNEDQELPLDLEKPTSNISEIYNVTGDRKIKKSNQNFLLFLVLLLIAVILIILFKKILKPKTEKRGFESLLKKP